MKQDKIKLARSAYNAIGKDYNKERNLERNLPHLHHLAQLLPQNASILDLGCGAGRPIDLFFSHNGFRLIGIDIS